MADLALWMTFTRAWTDGVVVAAEFLCEWLQEEGGREWALSIHGSYCLFENICILTTTQLRRTMYTFAIFGYVTLQGKVLLH